MDSTIYPHPCPRCQRLIQWSLVYCIFCWDEIKVPCRRRGYKVNPPLRKRETYPSLGRLHEGL